MIKRLYNNTLEREIRAALLENWDPLCIGDNPNLHDEYDSFIPGILSLLSNPVASRSELADYLTTVEVERLGVSADEGRIAWVAEVLLKIANAA